MQGIMRSLFANPLGSGLAKWRRFRFSSASLNSPKARTSDQETNVTFTVVGVGTGTLGYQWRFNGVDLDLENGPTLVLTNVTLDNNGIYTGGSA